MDGQLDQKKDVFHMGSHCESTSCNRLDFLPIRCDGCSKSFCNDHFRYESHSCPSGLQNANQVPNCPLCQAPIPVKRGEAPDIRVGMHIDSDCLSEKALSKRKVYTNTCSAKGCKKKEMMRVECAECRKSYCLGHRFPDDHQCQGPSSSVSRSGSAALARMQNNVSSTKHPEPNAPSSQKHNPANMSEDEAFARALQLSLSVNGGGDFSKAQQASGSSQRTTAQEDDDLALAQALAASEQDFQAQQARKKATCVMS
ncbi:putative AN1-type zinc finger protein 2B [Hypsibius exemplaris]|uniref:AN1-type zinc finger protein 2B n=1 Tax=Hypsibius exemplaris TaxID=2072580 RepID=A0A1W0WSI5_HYPEX|nr:putative AN1-type zinc finger protein 2B [Hypsibius exemplaris]